MPESMGFDLSRGVAMATIGAKLSRNRTPAGRAHARQDVPESAPDEVATEDAVGGQSAPDEDGESPYSVFAEAVGSQGADRRAAKEHVAAPDGGRPTAHAIARAADAHDAAVSRSGGEVSARVAASVDAVRDDVGNKGSKRSVRVSSAVTEAARAEFPGVSYTKALEAFVALHTGRAELAPESLRDEVRRRISDGEQSGATAAAIRSLARAVSELKYDTAVASMAAVALLSHWYDEELGRSGVPMSEWLGLSDTIFEVSGELSSQSAEYHEALRRSHGRRPKGYGRSR
jgi:hypothetical protein